MYLLETERLLLREFQPRDAKKLWELNANPDVIRYTGDPPFKDVEEAEQFIEKYDSYQQHGFGRWAVVLKSTQTLIGWCGLKHNELKEIDLGYRFFKKEWGKGYATESSLACLKHGFRKLGISSIMARGAKENIASIRVMQKLKMSYWKEDTCKGIDKSVYYKMTDRQFKKIERLRKLSFIAKEELSQNDKECVRNLWNTEYPNTLVHEDQNSFEQYLMGLSDPHHTLVYKESTIAAWFFGFLREEKRWFGMIVASGFQELGLGSKLLQLAQERHSSLYGWVIDKKGAIKKDGSPYRTPLGFYQKNGFATISEKRLEHNSISAVMIQWKKAAPT